MRTATVMTLTALKATLQKFDLLLRSVKYAVEHIETHVEGFDHALVREVYRDLFIDFLNAGAELVRGVLGTLDIPKGRVKTLQDTAKLFLSARNFPRSFTAWFRKNESLFEFLKLAATTFPEKQEEGSDQIVKAGPFTIHNTIQASGTDLETIKDMFVKAARYLTVTPIPNAEKVLYGNVFVVDKLKGHSILAWYYKDEDSMYVRPFLRKGSVMHNILHELGHRFWHQVMRAGQRTDWLAYDESLRGASAKTLVGLGHPDLQIGAVFPLSVKGNIGAEPWYIRGVTNNQFVLYSPKKDQRIYVPVGAALQIYSDNLARRAAFPTKYAATSPTEHFAETFAMYVLGTLTQDHVQAFDRILRGV